MNNLKTRRYDLHRFTFRQTFLPSSNSWKLSFPATSLVFDTKERSRPRNIWQISSGTDGWEISRIGEADFRARFSRFLHVLSNRRFSTCQRFFPIINFQPDKQLIISRFAPISSATYSPFILHLSHLSPFFLFFSFPSFNVHASISLSPSSLPARKVDLSRVPFSWSRDSWGGRRISRFLSLLFLCRDYNSNHSLRKLL